MRGQDTLQGQGGGGGGGGAHVAEQEKLVGRATSLSTLKQFPQFPHYCHVHSSQIGAPVTEQEELPGRAILLVALRSRRRLVPEHQFAQAGGHAGRCAGRCLVGSGRRGGVTERELLSSSGFGEGHGNGLGPLPRVGCRPAMPATCRLRRHRPYHLPYCLPVPLPPLRGPAWPHRVPARLCCGGPSRTRGCPTGRRWRRWRF